MTNTALYNAIRTVVKNAGLGVPVIYDNDPTAPPTTGPWIRCNIRGGEKQQTEISGAGHGTVRAPGVVIFQVFDDPGTGEAGLNAKTDALEALFRMTTVGTATFRVPYTTRVGRSSTQWQDNVTCPYFDDTSV